MDRGLDATLISFATAFDAVCAGVSTFTLGFLVARIQARYLGGAAFMLLAIASVLTIFASTLPVMFLSMALYGAGIGGTMFLQNFLWAEYFGRANLGSIRGIVTPIILLVGGIGAPAAGYVHDAIGSYDPIWWAGVGLMTIGMFAIMTTHTPGPPIPAAAASTGPA
jgi:MFS family permease